MSYGGRRSSLWDPLAKEDGEDGADFGLDASPGAEHPSGTIQTDFRVICSCLLAIVKNTSSPYLAYPPLQQFADPSRHLEAGVGWVSLATPREEDPRVFEGGSGDEELVDNAQTPPDTGITNVLIGASPSPGRRRCIEEQGGASRATPAEVVDERSRALLVGELDSVLRARPLPPTCEKHLPFEDRQSLEEGADSETSVEQNAEPCLHVPAPSMTPTVPIAENALNQDLVSELRAQISMAANEEIFSSNRRQPTHSSEDEEDSMLVGYEEGQHDRARSDAAREMR